MRIATWNVNSLKARLEKVSWWLERARPDVLLMQETKLTDADAPVAVFRDAGYELAHHGQGRWNGVAIASRRGIDGIVTNFGEPFLPPEDPDNGDGEFTLTPPDGGSGGASEPPQLERGGGFTSTPRGGAGGAAEPPQLERGGGFTSTPRGGSGGASEPPQLEKRGGGLTPTPRGGSGGASEPPQLERGGGFTPPPRNEARMIAATCGGVRVVSVYAPNGRTVGSPFFEAKLAWYGRLARWLQDAANPTEPLVLGGDFNVAPEDADVWNPLACHGGTHVSPPERAEFAKLVAWGLVDGYRLHHREPGRYTWWDYRAGNFHKNFGMRIDHLLATQPLAVRIVWAEIDREARKGKPIPSDHAPLVIDVDEAGHAFDAGWASAEGRIAARHTEAR